MVTAHIPLGPGSRITGEARETLAGQLCQRYQAGESIRAIAADLGRSYGFVQTLLREAGVTLRTRGGDTRSSVARTRQAAVAQRTMTAPAVEDHVKVRPLEVQQQKGKGTKKAKSKDQVKKSKKSKHQPKPPTPEKSEKSKKKSGKSKDKDKASKKKNT